ncbi:MAG: SDR family NAD(P)-dependent oxidoreductase [Clostridia bacterium]|nr:MAG: SDR family NAD(P)-dependent oxidoreductase [Clostridia bacterium]
MHILVTGGAGFIGRWVVARLLTEGHEVLAFDNLSSGSLANIREWENEPGFSFRQGDIKDEGAVEEVFTAFRPEVCFHLAASINVQDSLDNPQDTFDNDVVGTFHVLEACLRHGAKMVFMSTCMVYDRCGEGEAITETHPVKPASPYAGAKLAGEHLVLSYYHGYGLPVVVLRPFNTYGPFQKSTGEGGVISIFLSRALRYEPLLVYGDGTQTRDFLYVEDCAEFVVRAGLSEQAVGRVLNAGTGIDISINELAVKVLEVTARFQGTGANPVSAVQYMPHIHPQSEIPRLRCDWRLARELLGWAPQVSLEEGLVRTARWIR